jgi:hypothetical protein
VHLLAGLTFNSDDPTTKITEAIIGAAIEVHRALGPGSPGEARAAINNNRSNDFLPSLPFLPVKDPGWIAQNGSKGPERSERGNEEQQIK